MWEWTAAVAMWLMESSYLPQIVRLYQVKASEEFSLLFPLMNLGGRFLVMLYSYVHGEYILAWGFLGGLSLRSCLVLQVIYYRWLRRYWQRCQKTSVA